MRARARAKNAAPLLAEAHHHVPSRCQGVIEMGTPDTENVLGQTIGVFLGIILFLKLAVR